MNAAIPKRSDKKAGRRGKENGYILLPLLVMGAVVFCIALTAILGLQRSLKSAGTQRVRGNAFNIAESGKEHALSILRGNPAMADSMTSTFQYFLQNVAFSTGQYSVQSKSSAAKDTVTFHSIGTSNNQNSTVEAIYHVYNPALSQMKAVVNSRYSDQLLGNIVIDGRDWDSANTTVIGDGVLGIYTCDTVDAGGSSAIGGLGMAPPSKGIAAGSVQTRADTATFPAAPENILCVKPADLDKYRTPPPASTFYTGNNNIVYWDSCPQATISLSGSGIIICHNAGYSGTLRNVHGSFYGIIIADQINKVNANTQFLGVIFTLAKSPNGSIFGNGTPKLRYSSQIVKKMLNLYSARIIEQVSWKEL